MLLKVVGVWSFAGGVGELLSHLGMLGFYFTNPSMRNSGQLAYFAMNTVSPLVQLGLGAYLFFGGKWIVDQAIPGNRPYCHECGYDLTNAAGSVCAECGTPFKHADVSLTR